MTEVRLAHVTQNLVVYMRNQPSPGVSGARRCLLPAADRPAAGGDTAPQETIARLLCGIGLRGPSRILAAECRDPPPPSHPDRAVLVLAGRVLLNQVRWTAAAIILLGVLGSRKGELMAQELCGYEVFVVLSAATDKAASLALWNIWLK